MDALVAVAASVEPARSRERDAVVDRATGGPGLHPDHGAVELARGTAGDTEWLFQARVNADGFTQWGIGSLDVPSEEHLADRCPKLATRERSCVTSTSGSAADRVVIGTARPMTLDDGGTFPGFVVLMTPSRRQRAGPIPRAAKPSTRRWCRSLAADAERQWSSPPPTSVSSARVRAPDHRAPSNCSTKRAKPFPADARARLRR